MNAVVSNAVSVQSFSNGSSNTTNTKTYASSHIPERSGTLNRSNSSDSTGSAGIFVSRVGQKRMPMSTGRSIPLPSLYFRKSSIPVHEPPTLLRRTGDESAQFSQDHHVKNQQPQQQQLPLQQQQQQQLQPQQQQQPQEHQKQPQPPPPQEDIMSAPPLQFPERPIASTWFCRFCSYANVDLENCVCAVCGMDATTNSSTTPTATSRTMATAQEVPYIHQDTSSPSPTTLPITPAMDIIAVRSVSPSSATTHHPGPVETVTTIVPVNPFDEVSLMPPPTTLNRYVTPTTAPSYSAQQLQQDAPHGTISNLPATPQASTVTLISARSETCSLDLSQESAAAAAGRSFWRPRQRQDHPSTNYSAASPDTTRLPDPGESPVMPIRRKTPEPLQQQQQPQPAHSGTRGRLPPGPYAAGGAASFDSDITMTSTASNPGKGPVGRMSSFWRQSRRQHSVGDDGSTQATEDSKRMSSHHEQQQKRERTFS
jgi:hypothetical protein